MLSAYVDSDMSDSINSGELATRNRFWQTVLADPEHSRSTPPVASRNVYEVTPAALATIDGAFLASNESTTSSVTSPSNLNEVVPALRNLNQQYQTLDTAQTLSSMKNTLFTIAGASAVSTRLPPKKVIKPYCCSQAGCNAKFSHISSKYRHYRTVVSVLLSYANISSNQPR